MNTVNVLTWFCDLNRRLCTKDPHNNLRYVLLCAFYLYELVSLNNSDEKALNHDGDVSFRAQNLSVFWGKVCQKNSYEEWLLWFQVHYGILIFSFPVKLCPKSFCFEGLPQDIGHHKFEGAKMFLLSLKIVHSHSYKVSDMGYTSVCYKQKEFFKNLQYFKRYSAFCLLILIKNLFL